MHFLPTTATTTATGTRTKAATATTTNSACPRAGASCAVIYAPLERACQFLVVALLASFREAEAEAEAAAAAAAAQRPCTVVVASPRTPAPS